MTSKEMFDSVVRLLRPQMEKLEDRRTFVQSALFGCDLLKKIEWVGGKGTFTQHLVLKRLDFGECSPGHPAIVMLLEDTGSGEILTDEQKRH